MKKQSLSQKQMALPAPPQGPLPREQKDDFGSRDALSFVNQISELSSCLPSALAPDA